MKKTIMCLLIAYVFLAVVTACGVKNSADKRYQSQKIAQHLEEDKSAADISMNANSEDQIVDMKALEDTQTPVNDVISLKTQEKQKSGTQDDFKATARPQLKVLEGNPLLSQAIKVLTFPEDFRIGPLANYLSLSNNDLLIISFCTQLTKAAVNSLSLEPYHRELILKTLEPVIRQEVKIRSFRISRAQTVSAVEQLYEVIFLTKDNILKGDIYLTNSNQQWLVSDIQIDFSDNASQAEKPFKPGSRSWEMEN